MDEHGGKDGSDLIGNTAGVDPANVFTGRAGHVSNDPGSGNICHGDTQQRKTTGKVRNDEALIHSHHSNSARVWQQRDDNCQAERDRL